MKEDSEAEVKGGQEAAGEDGGPPGPMSHSGISLNKRPQFTDR